MTLTNNSYITKNGKYLILDISVKDLSYFENIYITSVIVSTTYNPLKPSLIVYSWPGLEFKPAEQLRTFNNPNIGENIGGIEDMPIGPIETEPISSKRLTLSIEIDGLGDRLFFIEVTINNDAYTENTPCDLKDSKSQIFVVYNKALLYNASINLLKSVGTSCDYDKDFMDKLLQIEAFKLSIINKKYDLALDYWNRILNNHSSNSIIKSCGCNG